MKRGRGRSLRTIPRPNPCGISLCCTLLAIAAGQRRGLTFKLTTIEVGGNVRTAAMGCARPSNLNTSLGTKIAPCRFLNLSLSERETGGLSTLGRGSRSPTGQLCIVCAVGPHMRAERVARWGVFAAAAGISTSSESSANGDAPIPSRGSNTGSALVSSLRVGGTAHHPEVPVARKAATEIAD
jgi:hypothetical protein